MWHSGEGGHWVFGYVGRGVTSRASVKAEAEGSRACLVRRVPAVRRNCWEAEDQPEKPGEEVCRDATEPRVGGSAAALGTVRTAHGVSETPSPSRTRDLGC